MPQVHDFNAKDDLGAQHYTLDDSPTLPTSCATARPIAARVHGHVWWLPPAVDGAGLPLELGAAECPMAGPQGAVFNAAEGMTEEAAAGETCCQRVCSGRQAQQTLERCSGCL